MSKIKTVVAPLRDIWERILRCWQCSVSWLTFRLYSMFTLKIHQTTQLDMYTLLYVYLTAIRCLMYIIKISVQFSCSVMSNSLQSHGLQHARLPCPSPTLGACSNSCPSSWWCHPTISSSVIPFSSCPQSLPALGSDFNNSNQIGNWKYSSLGEGCGLKECVGGLRLLAVLFPFNVGDSNVWVFTLWKFAKLFI